MFEIRESSPPKNSLARAHSRRPPSCRATARSQRAVPQSWRWCHEVDVHPRRPTTTASSSQYTCVPNLLEAACNMEQIRVATSRTAADLESLERIRRLCITHMKTSPAVLAWPPTSSRCRSRHTSSHSQRSRLTSSRSRHSRRSLHLTMGCSSELRCAPSRSVAASNTGPRRVGTSRSGSVSMLWVEGLTWRPTRRRRISGTAMAHPCSSSRPARRWCLQEAWPESAPAAPRHRSGRPPRPRSTIGSMPT